jgi:hypothetical protein
MIPTLWQPVWTAGFAQSFTNGPLFDFYAHDFGIPKPAAIAFGLAGAWPISLLIRLGLHAADAYAVIVVAWLGLAMFSAYQIARQLGTTRLIALLGGVAWMTMPIVWVHAAYGMLSLGIALLSFYFLASFRLFLIESKTKRITPATIAFYFTATLVSVFMDGYTFMMFATGASILSLYSLVTRPGTRSILIKIALPAHIVSFVFAYTLFSVYTGRSSFDAQPIDVFRAYGLDLSFIAIPPEKLFWLPDLLGFSLKRIDALYFGDWSVWSSTFALPVLLLGTLAWWRTRHLAKIATGVLLIAIFSFYMALGPSLKINSTKSETLHLESGKMPSEAAVAPTGSKWISQKLPGFKVMRASYRWLALCIFALWFLIMICVSRVNEGNRRIWLLGLLALISLNLPIFQIRWRDSINYRDMFQYIDHDLVTTLRQHIRPAETVAFIPWGNDFIANYIAPKTGFRTFNIGGDKNLSIAQLGWSSEMLALGEKFSADKAPVAVKMLIDGNADVLVLPYFHMFESLRWWPCRAKIKAETDGTRKSSRVSPACLSDRRMELQRAILALRKLPHVEVQEFPLFATVRLRPEFSGAASRSDLLGHTLGSIQYPIRLGQQFKESPYILRNGWYILETNHVWSQETAEMILPVTKESKGKDCDASMKFTVFGANSRRPVSVIFDSADQEWKWSKKIVADSSDLVEVKIPLAEAKERRKLLISIPNATSPYALNGSPDARVLGISLQRIDLTCQ